jgi:anti-sigma factor RsiW
MLPGEREVAGLRCSQVLESLSAYLDGELAPEAAARVRAHVAGCDACARFGAGVRAVVAALRETPGDELPRGVVGRLRAFLDASAGHHGRGD